MGHLTTTPVCRFTQWRNGSLSLPLRRPFRGKPCGPSSPRDAWRRWILPNQRHPAIRSGSDLFIELQLTARCVRALRVQRFAVLHAAAHELRPARDERHVVGLFGEQVPQVRVIPAQVMAGGVAVGADAGAVSSLRR